MKLVHRLDVALLFAGLVALLGSLVHLPAQAGHEPGGTNHPGGFFDKSVVADQAQLAVLDVGYPVEGVHQEAVGAVVQRDRHSVGGKVAAAEVVEDRRRLVDGFSGLGVGDRQSAANLHANTTREPHKERLSGFILSSDNAVGFLYIFLDFEGVSLNYYIEI